MRNFRAPAGRIIDFGGSATLWESLPTAKVVMLNLAKERVMSSGYPIVIGDGAAAPFRSGSAELAFSNSCIEHLGTYQRQAQFAAEMLRVGRAVYCQTPNRWFPVEPHFLCLFLHWLPARWRSAFLLRYFSLWGWTAFSSKQDAIAFRDEIRLLTKAEMSALFPGCEIITERFLGIPKSFIAVRHAVRTVNADVSPTDSNVNDVVTDDGVPIGVG